MRPDDTARATRDSTGAPAHTITRRVRRCGTRQGTPQATRRGTRLAMLAALIGVLAGAGAPVDAQGSVRTGGTASAGGALRSAPTAADVASPRPAGGLRTQPLAAGQRPMSGSANGQLVAGWYPLGAVDIARLQAAQGWVRQQGAAPQVIPVYVPVPYSARVLAWARDTTLSKVQAWRDIIVDEEVCGQAGCHQRSVRVRAPWVGACRCYGFRDGSGRFWTVE